MVPSEEETAAGVAPRDAPRIAAASRCIGAPQRPLRMRPPRVSPESATSAVVGKPEYVRNLRSVEDRVGANGEAAQPHEGRRGAMEAESRIGEGAEVAQVLDDRNPGGEKER